MKRFLLVVSLLAVVLRVAPARADVLGAWSKTNSTKAPTNYFAYTNHPQLESAAVMNWKPRFYTYDDNSWFYFEVWMWATNASIIDGVTNIGTTSTLFDGVSATNQYSYARGETYSATLLPVTNYIEFTFTAQTGYKVVVTNMVQRFQNDERRLCFDLRADADGYADRMFERTTYPDTNGAAYMVATNLQWSTNSFRTYTNVVSPRAASSGANPTLKLRMYGVDGRSRWVYGYWTNIGISGPAAYSNAMIVFEGRLDPLCDILPSSGPLAGGNVVLITNAFNLATNFLGNGDPGDITNVTVAGESVLPHLHGQGSNWVSFTAPPGGSPGKADIWVYSASTGATLIAQSYTYNPTGTISSVAPAEGDAAGGYPVTIAGANLGDGTDVTNVTLCGVSVSSIGSQSATQLVVTAGAGGAGLGDVRVWSTSYGESSAANAFTYTNAVAAPAPVVNRSAVNVRENGEGRFFVKLDSAPAADTTVTVARVSGDTDITVTEGAERIFTPANWDTWQRATLAAADGGDTDNDAATIQVTAPGATPVDVTATELDDDLGANMALAASGSRASGGGYGTWTIDGLHMSDANYGYTVWTNVPLDAMTLDLKATATVARVRLLNWDWNCIYQRYEIESSLNGTDWSPLVDASSADRAGWDDWDVGSVSARYLRLTGLTNTASKGVILSEWEVYGTRPPSPVVSRTDVNVRENGEGRFFVKLGAAPAADTTVTVARVSGDVDLSVTAGASLVFTPANWSAWQRVTLAAADDPDTDNGTATFQVTTPGAGSSVDMTAAELDDDIGTNVARSSAGSTISGGAFAPQLIDGTHLSSGNVGYTTWMTVPAPAMTLDLKGATILSRLRLLNWDWTARFQRYQVASSMNGSTWSNLVDASTGQHTGWDDVALDGRQARYLRLTGLYSSAGGVFAAAEWEVYGARVPGPFVNRSDVNVRENGEGRFFVKLDVAPAADTTVTVARVSGDTDITATEGASLVFTPANWSAWRRVTLAAADDVDSDNGTATIQVTAQGATPVDVTATELDDDIGTNLALASGGSTAAGGSYPGRAIDGIHMSSANHAYQALAQTITLDLKSTATVARVRLLNWDWTARYQRYQIEASVDGATWTNVVDASTGNRAGWEDWAIADEPARYLRLTGLYVSDSKVFALAEWEVYASGGGGGGRKKSADRSTQAGSVAARPATVVTSDKEDAPEYLNGWRAVDGNLETAWEGRPGAGGWFIAMGYDPTLVLNDLEVNLAEGSLTNIQYLYSQDAADWPALPEALQEGPVRLNYLWLIFPTDGTDSVPKVLEIVPIP